jgi:phenylpropionate dioxygenase-like ring-hydroxylating dioxygenase large terminal subunit
VPPQVSGVNSQCEVCGRGVKFTVHLLGMRLVLWQDKQGGWRCFEDMCPHR